MISTFWLEPLLFILLLLLLTCSVKRQLQGTNEWTIRFYKVRAVFILHFDAQWAHTVKIRSECESNSEQDENASLSLGKGAQLAEVSVASQACPDKMVSWFGVWSKWAFLIANQYCQIVNLMCLAFDVPIEVLMIVNWSEEKRHTNTDTCIVELTRGAGSYYTLV